MEDERALIQEAQAGDDVAFARLMERHVDSVYSFCRAFLGNLEQADDATQETFIKAWKNLKRFDAARALRPWLFAIARNSATDLIRRRHAVPFTDLDTDDTSPFADTITDDEPLPDELFAQAQSAQAVHEALETLAPRTKTLLLLRYAEHLSFEDIAQILKAPANTVRSLHRRALAELRTRLAPNREDGA